MAEKEKVFLFFNGYDKFKIKRLEFIQKYFFFS
jgi:hypothetical protein